MLDPLFLTAVACMAIVCVMVLVYGAVRLIQKSVRPFSSSSSYWRPRGCIRGGDSALSKTTTKFGTKGSEKCTVKTSCTQSVIASWTGCAATSAAAGHAHASRVGLRRQCLNLPESREMAYLSKWESRGTAGSAL